MEQDPSGGWNDSAEAWIKRVDSGDMNRKLVLDPAMLELCGDVKGLDAIDVGCGEGRFCRMLQSRGATVTGIDPTAALIEEARRRDPVGAYQEGRAENLPFDDNTFDLAISYVTLVDIENYREAIAEAFRILKQGGHLVAANLNGFATSVPTGWLRNEAGEAIAFPVDNYAQERAEWVEWCGIKVINWHRPLSAYMNAYLDAGLILKRFEEPVPSKETLDQHPSFADYLRVPYFNVMSWQKSATTYT